MSHSSLIRLVPLIIALLLAACAGPGLETRPALDDELRQVLAEAETARQTGAERRAEALLEQAVRMAPREPLVWYHYATLRLQQGRLEEARTLARKGLRLARSGRMRSQLWLLLAEVERRAGRPDAAEAALREAGVR